MGRHIKTIVQAAVCSFSKVITSSFIEHTVALCLAVYLCFGVYLRGK